MSMQRIFATLIIAPLVLAAPGTSFGQDELPMMEEITVTARKIGESIQDIPLSITAFTAEDIQAQAITGIEDIANFTPGLHMSNVIANRTDPALRFRGMDNSNTVRSQQLASSFVDGIYLSGSSQWVSMNDIERVEVVKGPQSAFFGRGTFGGAVNYITKTPGNEWAANAQLTAGQDGRADFEASWEGPIVADRLSFRLTGRYYTYDGGWDNEWPGGQQAGLPADPRSEPDLVCHAHGERLHQVPLNLYRGRRRGGRAVPATRRRKQLRAVFHAGREPQHHPGEEAITAAPSPARV